MGDVEVISDVEGPIDQCLGSPFMLAILYDQIGLDENAGANILKLKTTGVGILLWGTDIEGRYVRVSTNLINFQIVGFKRQLILNFWKKNTLRPIYIK